MRTYHLAALILAGLAPITPNGTFAQATKFSVLHKFTGAPDGASPAASLINVGGTLYGTTEQGGAKNYGSVFSITPAGVETVLYSFKGGADGEYPEASLLNVGGILYGTTSAGGHNGRCTDHCGTVFAITPAGVETVLHAFAGEPDDGGTPQAGLLDVGGIFYGTTSNGGRHDAGTVFSITPSDAEAIVHSFGGSSNDGADPKASLIKLGHKLYGTTFEGGANGLGTVFTVRPATATKTLYSFAGGNDGMNPAAPLLNVGGTLYGTTTQGGPNMCQKQSVSCGTVFTITPKGVEAVLYSFPFFKEGWSPQAGLIDVKGMLYGTTAYGGTGTEDCIGYRCGTLFKLTLTGVGSVVHSFVVAQGRYPTAGLLKLGNQLYGTAPGFDAVNYGTVFAVNPR